MFEWLGGDPLNGIVITIAFFISLIIGRHINLRRKRVTRNKKAEGQNG